MLLSCWLCACVRFCMSHCCHILFADGCHKLVRWRFIVHGGIDGFTRMVVYLHCSTNNRAITVYNHFLEAAYHFGLPSRVRSDQGRENYYVALHMLRHRGLDRGSMLVGSSTHNQRIERLWRDLFRCVLRLYYRLFYFLESLGHLQPLNEIHLYALHYVYLPRINQSLKLFVRGWNEHGIRTANNQSPRQLFTAGVLHLHNSNLTAMDFFPLLMTVMGSMKTLYLKMMLKGWKSLLDNLS